MDENTAVSNTEAIPEGVSTQGMVVVEGARKNPPKETDETKKMKENFAFFGPATAAYALFYAFCMYKNSAGITFPFFVAGSLFYFFYSLKKLGLTLKKDSIYYLISVMLLAISTFCTGDERMIELNRLGIGLLMISFLLGHFFDTRKWGPGKYLLSFVELFFGCFGELVRPFQDLADHFAKHQDLKKKKAFYVFLGLIITAPIFLLVAALLASADAVFRQVTDNLLVAVNVDNIVGIGFSIFFWFMAVYMLMAGLCNKSIKEEVKDHRSGEPVLAITVTSVLSMLYLYFCWIQIACLFLGTMELPEGYTYAEYAREGFFQLLAVAILNLVIVLLCLSFFRENNILKGVLTVMSLCTFVMIASSAKRMILYIQSYNLSFLRILVLWALVVLSFLFIGVLLCIFREKFPLFRYSMIVVTVFYLLLSFSHPDLIIAKVNLENAGGKLDYEYLSQLSSDAAPVLLPYLEKNGYDLSVVKIPKKALETQNGRASGKNPYWDTVAEILNNKPFDRAKDYCFGYFYLENIREDDLKMNFRTFNLSKFIAIKMAQ